MKALNTILVLIFISATFGCKVPVATQPALPAAVPESFSRTEDTVNSAEIKWREFFQDPYLVALIDTAIKNNPEVIIAAQEIEVAKNRVRSRKGMLLPTVTGIAGAGTDKVGRYTSEGAGNASTDMTPGNPVPEPLNDFIVGLRTNWEVDVWSKLRNNKRAAYARYLGSVDGRNLVITNLVAELANSYYELLSLDNQLSIIRDAIQLQESELEVVKAQKAAARATELAVKQFQAQVFKSRSMELEILQQIQERENEINFLLGRYTAPVARDKRPLSEIVPVMVSAGVPSQLLRNRPDVRMAEKELMAADCDVKAARAEFLPSFGISGSIGFQAFKPSYLFQTPESFLFSLAGDLVAPLVNRNAIKAEFNTAKAYQVEALYEYQKSILTGFLEVSNELSNINNLKQVFDLKSQQVDALNQSIQVSSDLFKSARADYLEVLTAQRDALESKMELVEARKRQLNSVTNIYKALGGGWK